MPDTRQECMHADKDYQSDQPNQGDRNKQNADHLYIAAGPSQHRGVSVSLTTSLRNVTGRDYLGAADTP